jgi:hypothetical protein
MKLSKSFNIVSIAVYLYLIIFIFLLCYTFLRAEFVHSGSQFAYYYKYYLIFIFGIIFWCIVLFLKEKKKLQIIVVATSIFFLLYFYETVNFFKPSILNLNFMKLINKEASIKSKLGEKSKYEVIQDLSNSKGIDVVPSIFPRALFNGKWENKNEEMNIFPLGGISNTITVFCKEGEEFSIYKSDRHGFNNPDEEWDNEKIFWLLIGDSFTQGACVKQGEEFAGQIRLLTKQSGISLGMSGNGPLLELASLKEYGLEKRPKAVLWFYFERNDLEDLKIEKSNLMLMKYLNEDFSQSLLTKQSEIDQRLKIYIQSAEKDLQEGILSTKKDSEKFLTFKKIIRLQILRDKMALDRGLNFGIDPLFEKILVRARDLVNKNEGILYFVYLPDKERYSNKKVKNDSYLQRSQVIELVNNLNIPIIDIHEEFFKKQVDPVDFFAHRIYGHYSPDGYHRISEAIVKKVNEMGINK